MRNPFTLHPAPFTLAVLRRPFVRDAGVLQLGSLAALGISFLLSVALARVLGREAYGAYALVVSAMTAVSLFKRLGQDYVATTHLAAAYARRDPAAAREALVSFNAVNLWSTLVVIPPAMVLAPSVMGAFFGDERLGDALRLALLPPIWAPAMATLIIILQSSRRVVALAILESAQTLALALCGLTLPLLDRVMASAIPSALNASKQLGLPPTLPAPPAAAMTMLVFAGQAAASLVFALIALLMYSRRREVEPFLPSLGALASGALRPVAATWQNFRSGLAVALDKNLISLYPLAPILLLGALAPTEEVALLRVAMSYLAVPLLALGAISRLLMVKLPELHATQPERMRRFFLQVTASGGAISILLALPFVILAPWAIGLLYGPEFAAAASLAPLLALDPLLAGFGIAAGPIYRTYGRNIWALWANLSVLALGLPLALLAIHLHGLAGAALAYAGLITLMRFVSYLLCLRIISGRPVAVAA